MGERVLMLRVLLDMMSVHRISVCVDGTVVYILCDLVRFSVLHCVTLCCTVLHCIACMCTKNVGGLNQRVCRWHCGIHIMFFRMLQCVAVCCSVLQCVAVCCSVLQTCI